MTTEYTAEQLRAAVADAVRAPSLHNTQPWRFRLIDGTELVGDVKGQPLWVQLADKKAGPFVLHERLKGTTEQKLNDLVHVQKVFVSRRLMEEVVADRKRRDEKPGK